MKLKNNLRIFFIFLLIGIFLISFVSAEYMISSTQYVSPGNMGSGLFGFIPEQSCGEKGQDFILQISPFGCSPAVVRSDLLEEQNVPVLCPISALKINPLIEVEAIEDISFSGQYSSDISGVGFHPAQSALGIRGDLNSPTLNNIGYAVIVLKKQLKESDMPEYVEGNLTARLKYDIENAFGIGKAKFYLPSLTDSEWEESKYKYGFWRGKGYLKSEGVDSEGARIALYDGDKKIASVNLDEGETSDVLYLSGFDCLAGLKLRLDDLEVPDTRARLDINGEIIEVVIGEKFLENKCTLESIEKQGLTEKITISCSTDERKSQTFDLRISPKIKLEINGEEREAEIGDFLYKIKDSEKYVYLGYIGSRGNSEREQDLYIRLIETPNHQNLTKSQFATVARYDSYFQVSEDGSIVRKVGESFLKGYAAIGEAVWDYVVNGDYYPLLSFSEKAGKEIGGNSIKIIGFGDDRDMKLELMNEELAKYYELSLEEYDEVINGFSAESYEKYSELIFGELAFYGKIELTSFLQQKKTLLDLCKKFKDRYPNSKLNLNYCEDYFLSNSQINTVLFTINSETKRVTFQDISEPSEDEYSVDVLINGEPARFTQNQRIDLSSKSVEGDPIYIVRNEEFIKNLIKGEWGENSRCLDYVDEAIKIGQNYNVDPLLLLSIMNQESRCNYNPGDGGAGCVGLMQICSWKICRDAGMKINELSDLEGRNNIDENIQCGAIILNQKLKEIGNAKKNYKCGAYTFTKTPGYFGKTEPAIDETYSGWKAAVRGYNGWGCSRLKEDGTEVLADHYYAEEVWGNYTRLGGSSGEVSSSSYTSRVESIKLIDLTEDYAKFAVGSIEEGQVEKILWKTNELTVKLHDFGVVGNYQISVTDINIQKVAKVSVIPSIDNSGTEATFPFKIGIDKRAIQLSPEKTQERLDNLKETIAKWEHLNEGLGKLVKGLTGACLTTGAGLTIKNFLNNLKGQDLARYDVMRGANGWYEKCKTLAKERPDLYDSELDCLQKNNDKINSDVKIYDKAINNLNNFYENAQDDSSITISDNFFGKRVDEDNLRDKILTDSFKDDLVEKIGFSTITISGRVVEVREVLEELNLISISEIRDLQLNADLIQSDSETLRNIGEEQVRKQLMEIYAKTQDKLEIERVTLESGVDINKVNVIGAEKFEQEIYLGLTFADVKDKYDVVAYEEKDQIPDDAPVALIYDANTKKNYLAILEEKDNTYFIKELYDEDCEIVEQNLRVSFKIRNSGSYKNSYQNPVLRYFETEPYKGKPAVVPFDLDEGWYTYVKPFTASLPAGTTINSYDDSGMPNNFYICNVMNNGEEEAMSGDDECKQVINRNPSVNFFPGMKSEEAVELVKKALEAQYQAQRAWPASSGTAIINGEPIKVGEPAADIPEIRCEDIYTPSECKLLFNFCDPVICPSSRCNFGGKYPVRNVVQTGVIGSLVLCAPNWVGFGGDVYVPICLTGVKAGFDNYLSVAKSYKDCLQTSLDTGETVGVCDAIYSIHLCEFFWRQAVPFSKLLLPKAFELVLGQTTSGGGEYFSVKSAWDNVENSIDYFTQYYAQNSYDAFKARSSESVGGEVCKNFASLVTPNLDAVLDTLTEPASPPQFSGWFSEIPFTTATNPPMSQYKVSYHIYAGNDAPIYYKVYLKGDPGSSFYRDSSSTYFVDSGYIASGEYKTETPDFLANTGYKQLCISVNNQEECGFQQVSTDFAVDFIKDLYMKQQASAENIKTESECNSGTASLYGLINPNVQEGVTEAWSPSIYNRGIIRICATSNPGKGNDEFWQNPNKSRWIKVGYCDEKNMGCWLDTKSVKEVIDYQPFEDEVLGEHSQTQLEILMNEGGYLSTEEFEQNVSEINSKGNLYDKVEIIENIFSKVFLSNQKGYLHLLKAEALAGIAKLNYLNYMMSKPIEPSAEDSELAKLKNYISALNGNIEGLSKEDLQKMLEDYVSPILNFDDGAGIKFPILDTKRVAGRFRFADSRWEYSRSGVVNTWYDVDGEEILYALEHDGSSDRDKEYALGLKGKDYREGLFLLLERVISDEEGRWYNNHPRGPHLFTDRVEFSSDGVFDVDARSEDDSPAMKFKFEGNIWKWSLNGDAWYGVDEEFEEGVNFGKVFLMSDANMELFEALDGKNLKDGAMFIFELSEERGYFEEQREIDAGLKKWTLEEALEEIESRRGSYSDNKEFIDALHRDGILTDEEYDEIDGIGILGIEEEDMNYVKKLLLQKSLGGGGEGTSKVREQFEMKENLVSIAEYLLETQPLSGIETRKFLEDVEINGKIFRLLLWYYDYVPYDEVGKADKIELRIVSVSSLTQTEIAIFEDEGLNGINSENDAVWIKGVIDPSKKGDKLSYRELAEVEEKYNFYVEEYWKALNQ